MKTNLICWLPNEVYINYPQFFIDNDIRPLVTSSYSEALWKEMNKPETLREVSYNLENIQPYKDEPFSVIDGEDSEEWVKQTVAKYPDVIMGESSTEDIQRLVECGCKNITFTAYGWHLSRLTLPKWLGGYSFNVRIPFTSQLRTWQYLEREYNCVEFEDVDNVIQRLKDGKWRYNFDDEWFEKYDNEKLFHFVWIMLDQDRHWEKLVTWAISHNKTIGLVAPDKHKDNPEWVKQHLTEFIKQYKEVVK